MTETYMNYVKGDPFFTYGSTDPARIRRLKGRIETYPDGVEVIMDDPDFGFMVHLPVKTWSFEAKPKKKRREVSAEEREVLLGRLAAAREKAVGVASKVDE